MKHMYQKMLLFVLAALMLLTPVLAGEAELTGQDVYCFSSTELSSEDASGVIITEVPFAVMGTVQLGNRVLRPGDVLTAESLNHLTFIPGENAEGEATISCLSITEEGLGENAEMTLKISSGKNEAPIAEDSQFETYKNIPAQIPLNTEDKENEPLTVNIVKEPRRGTVTLNADGTVTYTPAENKVGKDSFVYTVTDPAGNTSGEATVRINILKPSHKETYADMEGDAAHLAAAWLREREVYCGETVSGHLLFQPEEPVKRGEFIAMCMSLTAEEPSETTSAGFADDADTAGWLSPYVTEAVKCGYLTGIPTENGLMLMARQEITRGEAAVIISSMMALPQAEAHTVMAQEDTIPAWAASAVSATLEAGIFDATDYDDVLSRRDAAILLYDAWHTANKNAGENTLLSWAKE